MCEIRNSKSERSEATQAAHFFLNKHSQIRRGARCVFYFLLSTFYFLHLPVAKAGPDEAALLQQVKQLASKGQDAQTTAQVNQYVDSNQDVISAILKNYVDYLKQLQSVADDGEAPAPSNTSQTSHSSQTSQTTTSASQQTSDLQQSTALQITGVQASGDLETAHLAGYPALPDVDPTITVTRPTEYSIRVQKELQARKQSLMADPEASAN